jgi:hypothetical protein
MNVINILKSKIEQKSQVDNVELPDTVITDSQQRLEICHGCEHYFKYTAQCKRCGCFMKVKVKLNSARCPLKKW